LLPNDPYIGRGSKVNFVQTDEALKGLREPGEWIDSFILAVCKSVATVAPVRPPPADPMTMHSSE
jgi:hypothetical protein